MSGEITDSLEELNARCARLERMVYVLARATLAHEYSKDLRRAAAIEVFKALGHDENIEKADALLKEE